jgi:hypothetical protein
MLGFGNLLPGMIFNLNNHDIINLFRKKSISQLCRPIFSSEFMNTDKSKILFPPLPTIILKRAGEYATKTAVAAFGLLKTVDRDRIKRIILTGYVC